MTQTTKKMTKEKNETNVKVPNAAPGRAVTESAKNIASYFTPSTIKLAGYTKRNAKEIIETNGSIIAELLTAAVEVTSLIGSYRGTTTGRFIQDKNITEQLDKVNSIFKGYLGKKGIVTSKVRFASIAADGESGDSVIKLVDVNPISNRVTFYTLKLSANGGFNNQYASANRNRGAAAATLAKNRISL